MNKIIALVKSNTIVNCIVVSTEDDLSQLPQLFNVDDAFDVANVNPQPGIGWTWENGNWNPPLPPPIVIGNDDSEM